MKLKRLSDSFPDTNFLLPGTGSRSSTTQRGTSNSSRILSPVDWPPSEIRPSVIFVRAGVMARKSHTERETPTNFSRRGQEADGPHIVVNDPRPHVGGYEGCEMFELDLFR